MPVPHRGRGAVTSPPNRFERLRYEVDPELDAPADEGAPRTQLLRDASRTALVKNDSPDVGFNYSVNPYRGCEHGCAYCLDPATPILLTTGASRPIAELKVGDEVYGTRRRGRDRRYVKTRVLAHWQTRKPCYRVVLGDGTELIASGDHRFLTEQGWRFVGEGERGQRPHLTTGSRLMGTVAFPRPRDSSADDRRGYLAIRTQAESSATSIRRLVAWPLEPSEEWSRGLLAGVLEAEGSFSGRLRMPSTDPAIVEVIERSLRRFGFTSVVERIARELPISVVRLLGGVRERLRFLHVVRPAIARKLSIEGLAVESNADLSVVAIEPLGVRELVDITTGTGDFIAGGVVSHNCFARPTHEYLGFSAGLDFETKILVKEDAPELLRKELSSRSWEPQLVAISGVTDPYQPIERKLRLTRRCLEVFAELRNPVAIVTKNELVTRDADLLAELARHGAAAVYVSVTSLDASLTRTLEPRTSTPERRLAAIETLAGAGVPVGVLVAPVIPAVTDHEMPRILEAVARAGARFAGYVVLRLPGAVVDVFSAWLDAHMPDRKEKVLGRVRSLRGGKLYDPTFGTRLLGKGAFADEIQQLFTISCRRHGLNAERLQLSAEAFRRPDPAGQLTLF